MVKEKIMNQFFDNRPKPRVVRVDGQFKFKNLPKKTQDAMKKTFREKDPIINELAEKKAVGVKIDGREVTQEWADQLNLEKPEIKRDDGLEIVKVKGKSVLKKDGKLLFQEPALKKAEEKAEKNKKKESKKKIKETKKAKKETKTKKEMPLKDIKEKLVKVKAEKNNKVKK